MSKLASIQRAMSNLSREREKELEQYTSKVRVYTKKEIEEYQEKFLRENKITLID